MVIEHVGHFGATVGPINLGEMEIVVDDDRPSLVQFLLDMQQLAGATPKVVQIAESAAVAAGFLSEVSDDTSVTGGDSLDLAVGVSDVDAKRSEEE